MGNHIFQDIRADLDDESYIKRLEEELSDITDLMHSEKTRADHEKTRADKTYSRSNICGSSRYGDKQKVRFYFR